MQNNKVSIAMYKSTDRPYILFKDLTDQWNETTGFTRNIRGLAKAYAFLTQIFNDERLKDDLTFGDINNILDEKFKLNTHTYCAMD